MTGVKLNEAIPLAAVVATPLSVVEPSGAVTVNSTCCPASAPVGVSTLLRRVVNVTWPATVPMVGPDRFDSAVAAATMVTGVAWMVGSGLPEASA